MQFEKAYCLYRSNKTQEALAILNKVSNPEAKHKELKAQILYRLERYYRQIHSSFPRQILHHLSITGLKNALMYTKIL